MDKKELDGIKKEGRIVVGFKESRTFVLSQKKGQKGSFNRYTSLKDLFISHSLHYNHDTLFSLHFYGGFLEG